MQCEMCGKQTNLFLALVEGTRMNVCKGCASYGRVLQRPKPTRTAQKRMVREETQEVTKSISSDYAKIMRDAREKRKFTQEELAKKLNEKESLIQKMETGSFRPSLVLAQKIEKFLGVCLIEEEKASAELPKPTQRAQASFTLGDFIKKKK